MNELIDLIWVSIALALLFHINTSPLYINELNRSNDQLRSSTGRSIGGGGGLLNDLVTQLAKRRTMPAVLILALIFLVMSGCNIAAPEPGDRSSEQRSMPIPHSIVAEHEELHKQIQDAIDSGGETGEQAKLVADYLRPHFAKEEEYALPPLVMLAPLAQGKTDEQRSDIIKLSEKLSAELPQMLNEHKVITLALDKLVEAARKENKPSAIDFAERLRQHAQNEEEILYPSAILVGKYLKLRSP